LAEREESSNNKPTGTGVEQVEDIEALKQALTEEKERSEKYLANWQRAQADLTNYKKRAEQEKIETVEFANSTLILNLLTIVDDLERAFDSLPSELEKFTWVEGIKFIYNKFKALLEAEGLTEIKSKGELFDPHMHEAIMHQEGEDGAVIEEIRKGYKLKGRVLRPSMVVVGKGKEEKEEELAVGKEE